MLGELGHYALNLALLVAVIQAATQLQEQTLQYTLKFFAIVIALFMTAGLVASSLYVYTDQIFAGIPRVGR